MEKVDKTLIKEKKRKLLNLLYIFYNIFIFKY